MCPKSFDPSTWTPSLSTDKQSAFSKHIWVRSQIFFTNQSQRQQTMLYLPMKFRKIAMNEAHGKQLSGHDVVNKNNIRISDSYFWPGIKAYIKINIFIVYNVKFERKPMPNWLHCTNSIVGSTQSVHLLQFAQPIENI